MIWLLFFRSEHFDHQKHMNIIRLNSLYRLGNSTCKIHFSILVIHWNSFANVPAHRGVEKSVSSENGRYFYHWSSPRRRVEEEQRLKRGDQWKETKCEQWRDGKSFRQWLPCIGSSDNKRQRRDPRERTPFDLPVRTFSRCKWHEMALKAPPLPAGHFSTQSRSMLLFLSPSFSFFVSVKLKRNVDASRSIHREGHEKLGHGSAFPGTSSIPLAFPFFPVHSFLVIVIHRFFSSRTFHWYLDHQWDFLRMMNNWFLWWRSRENQRD